jgi:hypothetical protein
VGVGSRIEPTRLCDLALVPAAGTAAFVSAASGLVRVGSHLYVIADDALELAAFDIDGRAPGRRIRLFPGALPAQKAHRKRLKPDLEALVWLEPGTRFPNGALMALGSGSTALRRRGAILAMDGQGRVAGTARPIDLSPLYAHLDRLVPELNIEGAVATGGDLLLFNRGNRSHPENAMIRVDRRETLASCIDGMAFDASVGICPLPLGETQGVPFTVTDAASLPDGRLVATAVAENTADAYNDGACIGSAVALFGADGGLLALHEFATPLKVEGVAVTLAEGRIDVLLVTDADDPTIPAALYKAAIPLP